MNALVLACILAAANAAPLFDARDFGAKPDGSTLCTVPIQKAIDACASAGGGAAILNLVQTQRALIRGCRPHAKDGTFLKATGDRSRNIALIGNDFSDLAKPSEAAEDAVVIK